MFDIRPKKLEEIKPDTKMVFLVARGDLKRKKEYVRNNTPLHEAVLKNEQKEVVKLLENDKESKSGRLGIRHQSKRG